MIDHNTGKIAGLTADGNGIVVELASRHEGWNLRLRNDRAHSVKELFVYVVTCVITNKISKQKSRVFYTKFRERQVDSACKDSAASSRIHCAKA